MSNRRRDHRLARQLARQAHYKQNGLCFWCEQPMLLLAKAGAHDTINPRLMTADHVKPVWAGGLTIAGNIVAACFECNNTRSRDTNQSKRGSKFIIGDDSPSSPFAKLREQLIQAQQQRIRQKQLKWQFRYR